MPITNSILFIFLVLLVSSQNAFSQPDSDVGYYQNNALILDIAQTKERVFAVGEHGIILYSDDLAENWSQAKSDSDILLTSIFFINNKVGWITGHQKTILRTNDGGKTWQTQLTQAGADPLFDILFINEKQGIAIGAYGLYLTTTDGGKNWNRSDLIEDDFHLYGITSTGSEQNKQFFLAGESGTLLTSSDFKNWKKLTIPYDGTLFTVIAGRANITVAGLGGNVIQSTDNGNSWQTVATKSIAPIQGGTTLNDGRTILGGPGGSLLISNEANKVFSRVVFPVNRSISQILQISNSRLLISGDFGIRKSPINVTLLTINND